MRWLSFIFAIFVCHISCVAQQIINNPVFDRTDVPAFYITKVIIKNDTTYVYCSYYAEAGSWASISKDTYLRDMNSHKTYPLQRCVGLPYSPETVNFTQNESIELLFCFPSIIGIEQFDFIESEGEKAFNVYGISLKKTLRTSFTDTELKCISELMLDYDSSDDAEKTKQLKDYSTTLNNLVSYNVSKGNHAEAIRLETVKMEIKEKILGKEHPNYIESLGYLANYYSVLGNYAKAIQLQLEVTEALKNSLGSDNINCIKSFGNLVHFYSKIGNNPEAIKLGKEVLKKTSLIFGTGHSNYAVVLSHLAAHYSYIGNYAEAIQLQMEATEILKNIGSENTYYAISLGNLALFNSKLGNYAEAIRIETEAMELFKKIIGREHPEYAMSLNNLATYNAYDGNYSEAIRLGTEAMEIYKSILGTEHPDYAKSLSNLALYSSKLGNYSEAIRLGTEAMEIYKSILGTEHPDYAILLNNLASYNSKLGNYAESIRLGNEAKEICKREHGTEHPDYAMFLTNLATYNSDIGNYMEAIRLETEAMEILKRAFGPEHPDYATSLDNLAGYNSDIGNYMEAIRLGTEAMEIRKKILGDEHPDYATSLNNLATYNSDMGNYTETIRLGTEAMEIQKRVLGPEHPDYAVSLNNLATYNSDMGNYTEAIRLETEALEIRKRVFGTKHPDYAKSLSNLASYNLRLGNYSESIRLETEAMEIRKKVLGVEHPDYAQSLNSLATYNSDIGNHTEAIRLGTEAMEIKKRALGSEHPDYATSLNNLAGYNANLGNYYEARMFETEALEIQKRVFGAQHPYYATSLSNLAKYNSHYGYLSDAISLETEAMEIRKRVFGTDHPNYMLSLSNLASYYYILNNYEKAYYYLTQQIEHSHIFILKNLGELSSNYQKTLWTTQFAYEYLYTLPNLAFKYTNNESISELYNNTCLFAKGILLNTGIEMRKHILESNDSSLINKYKTLSTDINIYNKLIEKPIKERYMNTDSLNSVIQKQEMELVRESRAYGDYTRNLTINWKDVQRKLEKGDIAIEFLDYPLVGTNKTMYVALTLKKDYDNPHMVTLFEADQLHAIPKNVYYTQTDISDLIWKPLEEELRGVRNIYFAPSGELHRIGIEYLPISNTKNISDVYALHRLSSTRQLAVIQDETEGKDNILYGGLDYDEKSKAISSDSILTKEYVLRSAFSRVNVDSLSLRSSFDYLEGTKKETDMIAEDMKHYRVPYIYYSGIDGTEESFKQLDGTKPKLMHIATHGFFLTEKEAKKSKFARSEIELMIEGGQKGGRPVEDKPMNRSGLLFSGCNHAIHHEQIPDGEEDGILTAQEISMLDLRGLDLVVLSACQTGLGDIISGEGVFGLQRGFKKAGAKTILMSLDKVDDEATRILMVEFYRNLMSGKTKYQSLKDAQQYLRQVDNGKYDDPKYWASFIMLDGLN